MDKVLLLTHYQSSKENVFLQNINKTEGLDARCTFRKASVPSQALRRLALRVAPGFMGLWLGDWKKQVDDYDVVVYIASEYSPSILGWVHKHNSHARLVNYFWDKVSISRYPIPQEPFIENWSFNKPDCDQYGLRYNPQFFCPTIDLSGKEPEFDTVCICADRAGKWKHRLQMVRDCYQLCSENGIKAFFHFYTGNKDAAGEPFARDYLLSEDEYYDIVSRGKSVIEVVEPGQEWVTLRTFEALSNHKKLITNNQSILAEDFYSPANVFVLGHDDPSGLKAFLEAPFDEEKYATVMNYSVDSWADRFRS